MINKEHSEEQMKEVNNVVDEIINIFRKHDMPVRECYSMLENVGNRIREINILPNKENEPKRTEKFSKKRYI